MPGLQARSPVGRYMGRNHTLMFLSRSFSLSVAFYRIIFLAEKQRLRDLKELAQEHIAGGSCDKEASPLCDSKGHGYL